MSWNSSGFVSFMAYATDKILMAISRDNSATPELPFEIREAIIKMIIKRPLLVSTPSSDSTWYNPAMVSPLDPDSCPFVNDLPTEIRASIFKLVLDRSDHSPVQPDCAGHAPAGNHNFWTSDGPSATDLMCLNRVLSEEIAVIIYEERFFSIHVHEGLGSGGVEFVNAGRQPLQFQHEISDDRFNRFTVGQLCGVDRIKKAIITIFPAAVDDLDRHTAFITYLMNMALCRLLRAGGTAGKDNRLISLTIGFAPQTTTTALVLESDRTSEAVELYWWDPDWGVPRETSVHNLPNIVLALRPFSVLTGIHRAQIILPSGVNKHTETVAFASALEQSMTGSERTMFIDDELEYKIETARAQLEAYIVSMKYGIEDAQGRKVVRTAIADRVMWGDDDDFELPTYLQADENGDDLYKLSTSNVQDRQSATGSDPDVVERAQMEIVSWEAKKLKVWRLIGTTSDVGRLQPIEEANREIRRFERIIKLFQTLKGGGFCDEDIYPMAMLDSGAQYAKLIGYTDSASTLTDNRILAILQRPRSDVRTAGWTETSRLKSYVKWMLESDKW